ncbi:NrtA/SsuA/CpmA family ABC transporter substrate-binding protein [Lentisphaerota bacterium ZTH]|nr:NrtA/SsuA/CpmA family ABC transporter substrate-binding protein [Lentisphaerota bacterium]WET05731.1 NrtA/SsuA/CpmA family ABC transporter substrate-binding protein [Lentisphaerota bacterium ZTH]
MRVLFCVLSLFVALNLFGKEINVTYPRCPFNLQLIVMKHKGLLEKEFAKDGIKIKFHDIMNGPKQIEAAITGKVDICGSINTTSLIIAAGQNKKLQIIGAVCNPTNTLALMTNDPSIKSVKDLKGKTVACDKGATLHQLLLEVLAKNNMTIKDINYVPMVLPEVYDAIFTGKIDAGLLTTVETLKAKKRGARILATAKGLMRPKLVVAVNESFAKNHPDWVKRYIKVQHQAMEFIKNHKHEALKFAAKDLGISYQDAEWLYNNTKLKNTLSKDDIISLKKDIDFLYQQKLIPRKVNILSKNAVIEIVFKNFVKDQINLCAVSHK